MLTSKWSRTAKWPKDRLFTRMNNCRRRPLRLRILTRGSRMKFFHRAGWVINKMEAGLRYVALDRPVFPEPWEPEFNSSRLWAQPLLFYDDPASGSHGRIIEVNGEG